MNKDELLKIAKGDINFTFQSIVYSLALCLLVTALFLLQINANLKMGLIVCIIGVFGMSIYNNLNTRLNAALALIALSQENQSTK
ncbi:hypothetical protein CWC11_16365 [Pseudoalteromonas sp. S3178]|uniref:hypothetical protein n=1 Tax=Pseudoalteromonas sp. S3178 TaxID=579532 RepID=UPI00110A8AC7|nr:hypothetical protein [Pseudoalteromonas sp. S3178]TMP02799.1 hypothetical protein CWC11_16365 [Pseudoalteromonas sp. S3178]